MQSPLTQRPVSAFLFQASVIMLVTGMIGYKAWTLERGASGQPMADAPMDITHAPASLEAVR